MTLPFQTQKEESHERKARLTAMRPSPYDPYQSSEDEEASQDALLDESSDTFSVNSDLSYLAAKRQSMLCGCLLPGTSRLKIGYSSKKKERQAIMWSGEKMMEMEGELESERSKGRRLCLALFIMSFVCGVLFLDRLQGDWRGTLIEVLERGRIHESTQQINQSTENDSSDTSQGIPEASSSPMLLPLDKNDTDSEGSPNEEILMEKEHEDDEEEDEVSGDLKDESQDFPSIGQLTRLVKWNLPFKKDRDIPLYWHVPLSGTSIMNELLSTCYGLTQAVDDVGLLNGHQYDSTLSIVTNRDGGKYVNVDMGTLEGIERAKRLNLANAGITDVIRTSYLYETASGFIGTPKYGKCFALLRHPIERAISVFQKLKTSSNNPVFQNMNIEEYAKSNFCEENWMTRFLSNEMDGTLERKHLELAQSILGRKCIVGFTDNLRDSTARFSKFFGWGGDIPKNKLDECEGKLGMGNYTNDIPVDEGSETLYAEGSEIWNILKMKNSYDLKLFEYAKGLYRQQSLYG